MGIFVRNRVDTDNSTDDVLSGVQMSLPAVPNTNSKGWNIPLSAGFVSASATAFQ